MLHFRIDEIDGMASEVSLNVSAMLSKCYKSPPLSKNEIYNVKI